MMLQGLKNCFDTAVKQFEHHITFLLKLSSFTFFAVAIVTSQYFYHLQFLWNVQLNLFFILWSQIDM